MDSNAFLVARVTPRDMDEDVSWLAKDAQPYVQVDPVDFVSSAAISSVFKLYTATYAAIEPASRLNVLTAKGLLEYNRWVLIVDARDEIIGFALLKTSPSGLKFGLTGTNRSKEAKAAVKALHRRGLNVDGVYAEVSDPLERAVIGYVPEVSPDRASAILGKEVKPDKDGRHYSRRITNIGRRKKILVGKPLPR